MGKHEKIKKNKNTKHGINKYILTALSLLLLVLVIINVSDNKKINIGILSLEEFNQLSPSRDIIGNVIVKYIDTEGNRLKDDYIITGKVGELYTTTRAEISAFKTYGKDPINKIGNYDEKDITVTYVYQRKTDNVNIDNKDNIITVQILNESDESAQEVKMRIVAEDENGQVVTGGKYLVADENNQVIRNATSYVNSLLVGAIQLLEEGTEKFSITELSGPEGCNKLNETIQIGVTKNLNGGIFEVTSNQITSNANVRVEMISGEIVITILHTEEKIFDMKIENEITQITLVNDDGEEKITKQSPDEIIKIDIPKSKIENTQIHAKYAMTITNVGDIAGYVKEISNIIPDGMELVEGGNWTVSENVAKNIGLADNLLQPGESIIVYITLKWNASVDNIGIKTDKAIISNSISQTNVPDSIDNNNSDEDSFIISVRTGNSSIILAAEIVLIILISIFIVIEIIRKKKDIY